ncbi:MAG TPA: four helix bundle protein [Chloroflexia bacterium]|nr:four helix bundle protein [Chloroflexia bacterium]
MSFKFEKLEVWHDALEYVDQIYLIAEQLPRSEEYNLKSQLIRAATSVALNIAEGSTSQTNIEQARFVGLALRSLIETVACQHLISRRKLLEDPAPLRRAYTDANTLARKLQALRATLVPQHSWVREEGEEYDVTISTSDAE